MKPLVSIIMGSTSDLPVMEKAAAELDSMEIPFEMNALSAHRTPEEVCEFAKGSRGARHQGHHCRCGNGCGFAGSYCRPYHIARYRCAH